MKQKLLYLFILCNYAAVAQITIGSGTAVDSNAGLCSPISNWYNYSLSQTIYLASEINASGTITSLQFPQNNATAIPKSDDLITVWIGHTTKTQFSSTVGTNGADIVDVSTMTKVMDNGSLVKTGTTTTYTLTTPFAYNGTDNLIVVVNAAEFGNDGNSTLYLQSPTTAPRAMMIRSDAAVFNATTPSKNFTGTLVAESWQQKSVRPIVTINGLTPLSTPSFDSKNKFSLYPNPATEMVNLDKAYATIEVYDLLGKLVLTEKDSDKISVSDFVKGIYIVKVSDENGASESAKLLKN